MKGTKQLKFLTGSFEVGSIYYFSELKTNKI